LQSVRTVACPRCGKKAAFNPDNKWRPFCSERCRTIDLGKWAAEDYRVPQEEKPEDEQSKEEKP
jgi:endogenous inhibitor of DNA gyrase (YacG/DUF329 family)